MRKIILSPFHAFRIRYGILIGTIAFYAKAQWILLHDPIYARIPETRSRFEELCREYAWWRLGMDKKLKGWE